MPDQTAPDSDTAFPITDAIRADVQDALYLLDFAISTGLKKPDGRSLSEETIAAINAVGAKVVGPEAPTAGLSIKVSELTRFDLNYAALAEFTSPVTAETLRDTESTGSRFREASPAQKFSRLLWLIAILLTAAVLLAGFIMQRPEANNDNPDPALQLARLFTPWIYGGLGAVAYLLRSAHVHVYQRTFDARHKPEYLNRILLGAISGGAVIVLINQLTDQAGTEINLSSAALGFIAGYNADFLFNTVERIVAAMLPKVGLESVQRASRAGSKPPSPPPDTGLTLKELLERMEKADDKDKELYRSLVGKFRDRI
jgi:hypothetical protein